MKLLEQVEVRLEWKDLENLHYHPRPHLIRSPGPHVSDILRGIAIKGNMYTEEDRKDDMPLRVLLGLAFEESAARLYPKMHWQPGQIEWDGVIGSPDGISPIPFSDPQTHYIDEFKYTGKSQRVKGAKTQANGTVADKDLKDIRGEWLWMQQGMSYLNLLRLANVKYRKIRLARFHICWKYGPYAPFPYEERYMRYLVEFSDAELRGNWAMLQERKGRL